MHRLFVNPQNIKANKVFLQGEPLRKLRVVLRLKPEDTLYVFDGTGCEYLTEVISLNPHEGELKILKKTNPSRESPLEIHLGQALPKANKMDLIVQKAVELGVSQIHPFYSARTLPFYKEEQIRRRVSRWQKIAREASRQSGRTRVPEVHFPADFSQLLTSPPKESLKFILQKGDFLNSLKNTLGKKQKKTCIYFLVGPEGGFIPEEVSLAVDHGFKPLSLGLRTLRTETVPITFLSIIQYELGDLS